MILDAARAAAGQLFSQEFRSVFFKTLGLTLLALAALWFGLKEVFDWLALPFLDALLPGLPGWAGWLGFIAAILAGIGLALGLALLIAPVTAIVAGLFLDDVAETVERTAYPLDPPGKAVPVLQSMVLALKFFAVVIVGNLIALLLLLVPGVNIGAFFLVNGYLLGREFFEFAAMRFRPEADGQGAAPKTRRHGVPGRPRHCGLSCRAAAQSFDPALRRRDDGASPQDDRGAGNCRCGATRLALFWRNSERKTCSHFFSWNCFSSDRRTSKTSPAPGRRPCRRA